MSKDNDITKGVKKAEPFMLIFLFVVTDYLITYKIHKDFPFNNTMMLSPSLSNQYWFVSITFTTSLILYAIAIWYEPSERRRE